MLSFTNTKLIKYQAMSKVQVSCKKWASLLFSMFRYSPKDSLLSHTSLLFNLSSILLSLPSSNPRMVSRFDPSIKFESSLSLNLTSFSLCDCSSNENAISGNWFRLLIICLIITSSSNFFVLFMLSPLFYLYASTRISFTLFSSLQLGCYSSYSYQYQDLSTYCSRSVSLQRSFFTWPYWLQGWSSEDCSDMHTTSSSSVMMRGGLQVDVLNEFWTEFVMEMGCLFWENQNLLDKERMNLGISGRMSSQGQIDLMLMGNLAILLIPSNLAMYPPMIALQIEQSTVSTASMLSRMSYMMASTSQQAYRRFCLVYRILLSYTYLLFRMLLQVVYFWSSMISSSWLQNLLASSIMRPCSSSDLIRCSWTRVSLWDRSQWMLCRDQVNEEIYDLRLEGIAICLQEEERELRLEMESFLAIILGTEVSFITLQP